MHIVPKPAEPIKLTLHFAKAAHAEADLQAMDKAFFNAAARQSNPDSKHVIDRGAETFLYALKHGRAAFWAEQGRRDNILAATFAYHADWSFTEIGSTISVMPGFNATMPLISALSLHEHGEWPQRRQVAAIGAANERSLKTYQEKLGWDSVEPGMARRLYEVTGKTPFDEKDERKLPSGRKVWVAAGQATLRREAAVLTDMMELGGLYNSHTRQVIEVDYSELPAIGLSYDALCAQQRQAAIPFRALRRVSHG